MADLHLRACRWFAGQGEPIPAIRHAGHARRWDEVGRLLTARGLPLILTASRPALIAALAPAAAQARVDPTASTLLAAAVCHYHRHDYDEMARDAGDAAALMDDAAGRGPARSGRPDRDCYGWCTPGPTTPSRSPRPQPR